MMSLVELYRKLPEAVRAKIWEYRVHPDEIHIERIGKTFDKTFRWLQKRPSVMMFFTFSEFFPYTSKVKKCYQTLIDELPNTIGLHVHLCNDSVGEVGTLPIMNAIYERMDWARRELDALLMIQKGHKHPFVSDFCSGRWNYNHQLIEVCKMLYLTRIHLKTQYIPAFTQKWGWVSGVELIPVVHNIHDYDL